MHYSMAILRLLLCLTVTFHFTDYETVLVCISMQPLLPEGCFQPLLSFCCTSASHLPCPRGIGLLNTWYGCDLTIAHLNLVDRAEAKHSPQHKTLHAA